MNIPQSHICSLTNVDEEGQLYGVSGSSGGYAETIFRHAAKALYGQEIKEPLVFKTVRNSDFREVSLEVWLLFKQHFLSFILHIFKVSHVN